MKNQLVTVLVNGDKYVGNIVYLIGDHVSVDLGKTNMQLYSDSKRLMSDRILVQRKLVKRLVYHSETGRFGEEELA